MDNPELWVAVGFFVFVGVILWKKVPAMIGSALDARSAKIASEIEEARALKDEATSLLARYQRKQRGAEQEAEAIIDLARVEAKQIAKEARQSAEEFVERRTRLSEEKITRAEAKAIKEVEAAAAEIAIAATEEIIRDKVKGGLGDKIIDEAIQGMAKRLH